LYGWIVVCCNPIFKPGTLLLEPLLISRLLKELKKIIVHVVSKDDFRSFWIAEKITDSVGAFKNSGPAKA